MSQANRGHLDMLLLGALHAAEGPVHGYALIETLRAASLGYFDYAEGVIYPALHQLEADGLAQSAWATVQGRRRRTYVLTPKGHLAFAARKAGWREFTTAVESVIGA